MHLFSGDVETLINVVETVSPLDSDNDLASRVEALENDVAELKQRLASLLEHLGINRGGITYRGCGIRRYRAKAQLPVLGAATDWTLAAARSPTREKAQRVCDTAYSLCRLVR